MRRHRRVSEKTTRTLCRLRMPSRRIVDQLVDSHVEAQRLTVISIFIATAEGGAVNSRNGSPEVYLAGHTH